MPTLEEMLGTPKNNPVSSGPRLEDVLGAKKTDVPIVKKPYSIGGSLKDFGGQMANVATGALKGLGSTVAGAESIGEKIVSAPYNALTGRSFEPTIGEQVKKTGILAPKNTAQKLGFGAEQVGETFTPGLDVEKGLGLGAKMGAEALKFGGLSALQSGGDVGQTLTGAATGGAFPLLGKVAKPLGKVALEMAGHATGTSEAALREAFNNPNVMKFARKAGAGGAEDLQAQALKETQAGLESVKASRGKSYQAALEKIKTSKKQLDNVVRGTREKAAELLDTHSVQLRPGRKLNNLDFSASVIEKGQKSVEKAFNDVMNWTENTPAGLDRLKKKLASHLNEVKDAPGAYQFIKDLHNSVRSGLETNVKGYQEMTSGYHKASDLIEEIQKDLSLSGRASHETSIRKIMGAVKQDNELRQDLLRTLGAKTGKDILGKVAGSQLAPLTARGVMGRVEGAVGAGGIAASIINPAHIPALLTFLASTSPRLVGEAVSILGQAQGKLLTVPMKKALQGLLIEAARQGETQMTQPTP